MRILVMFNPRNLQYNEMKVESSRKLLRQALSTNCGICSNQSRLINEQATLNSHGRIFISNNTPLYLRQAIFPN
jgi:peroxiredoxin